MYVKHNTSAAFTAVEPERTRRSERRARRFRSPPVSLEILDTEAAGAVLSCFDLSTVGVYLHSELLYSIGEKLRLRIRVPFRHRPVDVVGEVVRVETGEQGLAPGMGIAFRDISETDAAALKQFLLRRFLSNA